MADFLKLKNEVFGLDIDDMSMKVVKVSRKRGGFVLDSFNEVRISSGIIDDGVIEKEDALIKIIKSCCEGVKGKKIKTKYVVASLPEKKTFLQVIQMPKMTEEELQFAVPIEAENYIPLPMDSVYLDFQVLKPIKDYLNYSEVLIVAAPKNIIDSYVSCFKKANLVPVAFEAESQAITRALIKGKEESSFLPLTILVDFGENKTNLIIFSGNSIRFTASIPFSSRMLTEEISKELNTGFNEAEKLKIKYGFDGHSASSDLRPEEGKFSIRGKRIFQIISPMMKGFVEQIKKYIDFYQDHSSYEYMLNQQGLKKVVFCGGGSQLRGILSFMSKELDMPVELGNPTTNLVRGGAARGLIKENFPTFATAIGLALRQPDNKKDYEL